MSTVSKYNNRPYWNVVCMCTTLGCAVQAWKCAPSLYCLRHRETEHPGWRKGSWCWHTFGDTDTQMSKMYTKTLPQFTQMSPGDLFSCTIKKYMLHTVPFHASPKLKQTQTLWNREHSNHSALPEQISFYYADKIFSEQLHATVMRKRI